MEIILIDGKLANWFGLLRDKWYSDGELRGITIL